MEDAREHKALNAQPYHVRWHNSLIVRVVLLCVVLIMCLFGSVGIITSHYFGQMVEEMRDQTEEIVRNMAVHLEQWPDATPEELEDEILQRYDEMDIQLQPASGPDQKTGFMFDWDEQGQITKVWTELVAYEGGYMLLSASIQLRPQTEIIHAFKNKYLGLLAVVFVVALAALVYVISRSLQPLKELSESCVQISEGNLRNVKVRRTSGEVLALERVFNSMVGSLREKEMMEAKLRQAQRLSAIGTLAAGVAHDVRNPLNAIKLLSSHAIDSLGQRSADESARAVRHLHTIRNEVDRLEDIVSGFLSLARERELQPEPTPVDSLLRECVRLVRKDAETRAIRLIADLRAGDTPLLLDPKQMTRAVLNVLLNAMEACPRSGRVRLFSRLTDETCEIEVRDDGPGLSPEAIERAFDPYFTTKSTGTGLGLSITRGVIEEHGGTIDLTSTENTGCQVLISLPLQGPAL